VSGQRRRPAWGNRGELLAAANYLAIMPAPMASSIAGVAGGELGGRLEETGERRSACAASPSSSRNRPETPLRIGCGHLRTHSQSGWLPTCRPRRARRPVAWRQSFSVLTIRRRPTSARPNHGVIGIEGGAIDPPEGHSACVDSRLSGKSSGPRSLSLSLTSWPPDSAVGGAAIGT
jgi:hypothetical protein